MIEEMIPDEWLYPEALRWVVEFVMSLETSMATKQNLLLEWAERAGVEPEVIAEVIAEWQP